MQSIDKGKRANFVSIFTISVLKEREGKKEKPALDPEKVRKCIMYFEFSDREEKQDELIMKDLNNENECWQASVENETH